MDYSREDYERMQQEKIPYYMTHSMQNVYETEREYQQDMERIKELYPYETRRILRLAEDACDRMEYEGSLMYEEYPDKVLLYRIARNIVDEMQEFQKLQKQDRRNDREMMNLVEIILYNEIYRRRCRHRRCRRWW